MDITAADPGRYQSDWVCKKNHGQLEADMKKLWLALGAIIGFVLGSRAGRGPYRRLESKAREVWGRPEVQQALDTAGQAVRSQGGDAADSVRANANDAAEIVRKKVREVVGTGSSDSKSSDR
jgi:hypothetical protein